MAEATLFAEPRGGRPAHARPAVRLRVRPIIESTCPDEILSRSAQFEKIDTLRAGHLV